MKWKLKTFKAGIVAMLLGLTAIYTHAQSPENGATIYRTTYDGAYQKTVAQWEAMANDVLQSKAIVPQIASQTESPYSYHTRFWLLIDGRKVHERQLSFHLSKAGGKLKIAHNADGLIKYLQAVKQPLFPAKAKANEEEGWLFDGETLLPVWSHFEAHTDKPGEWLVFLNANGMEIKREDQNLYYQSHQAIDTPVQGKVFYPDPITTSQKTYGNPGLTDRGDSNSAELTAALRDANFRAGFKGGLYVLEDDNFEVIETALGKAIPTPVNPVFNYNRSEDEFESVNAFYHLTTQKTHVDALGYTMLPGEKITIDAHCCKGDESMFQPGQLALRFGDGGIDDAEDADILVHEFTHALIVGASPATGNGFERKALDEGICDYMAGSYSNAISTWQWEKVFNWDGNLTWQGRSLNSARVYPVNTVAGFHRNGEIISKALMKLWFDLGRDTIDALVLESLFSLVPDMLMPQYAEAVLDADSVIFGGIHAHIIRQRMAESNLMTPSSIEAFLASDLWKIYGSADFAMGSGDVRIAHSQNKSFRVVLISMEGKELLEINSAFGNEISISPNLLPPGVYLIRMDENGNPGFTSKLLKY